MKQVQRQIALIYLLLHTNQSISLKKLMNEFEVSEKTIRTDIDNMNYALKKNKIRFIIDSDGVRIHADSAESLAILRRELDYRYMDVNNITSSDSTQLHSMLSLMLNKNGYIKVDEIAANLGINQRSVTEWLKELRLKVSKYKISLTSKPHYGLRLDGDELNIRMMFADSICYYSTSISGSSLIEDSFEFYGVSEEIRDEMYDLFLRCYTDYSQLTDASTVRKLMILSLVSFKRFKQGHKIDFNNEQRLYIDEIIESERLDRWMDSCGRIECFNDPDERRFIKLFYFANLYYDQNLNAELYLPDECVVHAHRLQRKVYEYLTKYQIVNENGYKVLGPLMQSVITQCVIRMRFNLFEYTSSNILKDVVYESPLSATISLQIMQLIEQMFDYNPGDLIYIRLGIAIYSYIRSIQNSRNDLRLGLYVPYEYQLGATVKQRILDRFSNCIKDIRYVNAINYDEKNENDYSAILYIEDQPEVSTKKIPHLKINSYFTEEDVRNFYELIVIPTRQYKRAFAPVRQRDYVRQFRYVNLDLFIKDLAYQFCDTPLFEAILALKPSRELIVNYTLNLILFTSDKTLIQNKLVLLDRFDSLGNVRFNRIFFYSIYIGCDSIALKTSEKVIRNMSSVEDTEDIVLRKNIDFYDYYIYRYEHGLVK